MLLSAIKKFPLIFFLIIFGFLLAYFKISGKLDAYFEKKYPVEKTMLVPLKIHKIGFVTDAHAKFSKYATDIHPQSKIPMIQFVSRMNESFNPRFVIDGGDFIEGTARFGQESKKDFELFENIIKDLKMPHYHMMGNHEIRGFTKNEWLTLNNYEKTYYYFDDECLRIFVLDSTMIPASDEPNRDDFNEELVWLENALKNSSEFEKIVFIHNPPLANISIELSKENLYRLQEIFSNYGVSAVFSGHKEIPYYEKINGVEYFIIPGFYRGELRGLSWIGSFSEIIIGSKNSLKLFYKNNEDDLEYKTLIIPSEEYEKIEKQEIAESL